MTRILTIVLISAIVGVLAGATMAYVAVVAEPDTAVASSAAASTHSARLPSPVANDEKQPRLQIDAPHFEFGSMQTGTKKTHTFAVKNVGGAPLTIRVGHTSCTCTVGAVTDKPIPPGGSGEVRLEWTAKSGSGPFQQTATLESNDPLQSQVELSVRGEVTDVKGLEPPGFAFDKLAVGESKTAVVHVMAMLQDEVTVSEPQLTDPLTRDKFDIQIEPLDAQSLPDPKAKAGVRITLTAKSGLPLGRINQALAVKTNLPDAEHLEIPVVGQVVGDISVHGVEWNSEQGVLTLGKVKSSAGKRAKVNIVVRGADAGNVRFEVQSRDPPELKITLGEPKQLKEALLHVPVEIEVPAGTRPMVRLDTAQGEAGRVVLKTTHPAIQELVLDVRFAVER